MLYFILCNFLLAQQPGVIDKEPDESIVVYAHKDMELYVAPVIINNTSKDIEANVSDHSIFGYASTHSKYAKILNDDGSYEPIKLNNDGFKVYNKDTIGYTWEGCNYAKDHRDCSYRNNHFFLETYIDLNDEQVVVTMQLFDSDMQIVASSNVTNTKIIRWIKQQEISSTFQNTSPLGGGSSVSRNCSGNSCSTQGVSQSSSGLSQTIVSTNKPKEELPLKWVINHRLLDKHIHQASLLLWCSAKVQ